MRETENITAELRADILSGEYTPGERLVELRLSERYCCGRTAVRAAIAELRAEGLVDCESDRTATVRQIGIGEAVQINQARAALESLVAAEAARKATPEQSQELERLIRRMERAVENSDSDRYSETDTQLHATIREIGDHIVANHLINKLRNRAAKARYQLSTRPGRAAESLEQHRAIVDAIVQGNPDAASAAMEKHLLSVIDVLNDWHD